MASSKKKKCIEIIPENAEFEQVRSLGEESLGDESLSEDIGNDKDTSEQEEISRKRKGDSLETQQSNQPYQKKQRQKKARCWPYLDVVVENNQKIAICKFCKTRMKCGSTGCTTTLNRHVDKCRAAHGQTNQALLQFQPSDALSSERETPKGINDYESFIRASGGIIEPTKSELEEYLTESIIPPSSKFDVLAWWKANASKFPILSKMASDVLSIPISTVASESTFSAGSRVIEPHRSCLKPETVEVLLCGADWVRELYGLKKSKQNEDKDIVIHLD
ncbi:hypothetical protein POM88_051095 [Heracleum sosnowskyi]|uniref:BED-type domain-containing protein n=1 Tax=Heracleum sosnowskyi TaxID=360622 RepID=A0AAD8H143_9APIA|nr:hypothetical protein POM88_051095 [Heracleum sosnowskyi]